MSDVRPDPLRPFHHVLYDADSKGWLNEYDDVGADDWLYYIDISTPCPVCGGTGACGYDVDGRPFIHVEETFNE